MSAFPSIPVNATAVSIATAHATNYVLPSVDEIFAAGTPLSQVNQSNFLSLTNIGPGAIFPGSFGDLYYNLSFLWPQLETTGIILDTIDYCTPQTCSLLFGNFLYLPNLGANAFFAAIFGLALLATIPLAIRARSWGYLVGMIGGLLCEVLGYIGRILMAQNDFNGNYFYIYIICLTIGPAFLCFSIYTCLARIIVVYGKTLSRFKPKTYTYVFATSDFISLVLQGGGGGLAATADDGSQSQMGVNIMIGGLAFQVFSLSVFITLCSEFAFRVYRRRDETDPNFAPFRHSLRFRSFLAALVIATVTIFVRSVYRVAELQQGFHSKFANNEITYMVLESSMVAIAVIALTALHPGVAFGSLWRDVSAMMKTPKAAKLGHGETSAVATPRDLEGEKYPAQVLATHD